jgi:hypothetical protein
MLTDSDVVMPEVGREGSADVRMLKVVDGDRDVGMVPASDCRKLDISSIPVELNRPKQTLHISNERPF